jgi:gluconokinase
MLEAMNALSSSGPQERLTVVVMGVSGSGKSTLATGIASALSLDSLDGDALHLPQSVSKMAAGIPLADADRWPWLDRIAAKLADADEYPLGLVVACSALKRSYRDRLRRATSGLRFVFLDGPPALIASRLGGRSGHFMPSALLESQLQALERPGRDEPDVLHLSIESSIDSLIRRAAQALKEGPVVR